jgi:TonB-linked SusC/RagA family outer membrane protein
VAALTLVALFAFMGAMSAAPFIGKPVKGRVTDENNQPLGYVTVKIKNGERGTFTDMSGNFELEAEDSDVLVFSYLGYEDQEVPVGANSQVYIAMKPVNAQLDQVVVVAYGTQKKRAVTNAVSSVKGEQLARQPLLTAVQGIQGMAPGIRVIGSSEPGAQPRVNIRGINTIITNENPLFVVDGILTSDITNISTSDILSVDVLKDGAGAMYGSRSGNGVVLITTKRGQSGKPKVSLDYYQGFRKLTNIVKMADREQYLTYTNEARANEGIDPIDVLDGTANTDWYDAISQNGLLRNATLNVNGGANDLTYLFSASFLQDEGVLKGAAYDRLTLRSNNDYHISKRVNIGNTFAVNITDSENKSAGVFTDAYRASPAAPVYTHDSLGTYGYQPGLSAAGNPVANLELTNNHSKSARLQGSLYGDVLIAKGLTFRSSFGFDRNNFRNRSYDPVYQFGSFAKTISELRVTNGYSNYWLFNNTLNLKTTVAEDHGFDVVLGASAEQNRGYGTTLRGADVPDQENLWYLSQAKPGSVVLASEFPYFNRRQSTFGRLNYGFRERYNLTGVLRRDGSSGFPKDQKYLTSYSVGASWIVSDENFFKNNLVSNLKLRGSYYKIGNDAIVDIVNNELSALLSVTNTSPYFTPGGGLLQGLTFNQLKDPQATWEITTGAEVGAELGLMNNRLQMEVSLYNKLTNAYIPLPTPAFIDPNGKLSRAADVRNKGIEVDLNYRQSVNKDFNWRLGVNGTFNKNEVEEVRGGNPEVKDGGLGNGHVVTSTLAGQPIGSFWVFEVEGVFQNQAEIDGAAHITGTQPGDFKFRDVNFDNIIDDRDRLYVGSYQPKVYFGLNGSFNYKALDFSIDCYGNVGNKIFNGKKAVRFGNENVEASRLDRWTPTQTNTGEYRASNEIPRPSTYFVESGNFFRINNVTLGYTLPGSWTRKASLEKTRIFFSAQNPIISKKFSGFSPELPGSNALNSGIELSVYPTVATYMLGVNLNFQ